MMDAAEEDAVEQALVAEYLGHAPSAFVEVGANHPQGGSQTWHLAQRGWRGILVEPQGRLHELLQRERPDAFVVRAACTARDGTGTLVLHIPTDNNTGFATLEPNKDDPYVRYGATETVAARTLDSIVADWRAATGSSAPIRFVSIDVEGHELGVLQGFSLGEHRPALLLVEDKLQDLSKHRYLGAHGYKLVRRTCMNNWYIPASDPGPRLSLGERLRLFRKVYLGLPFRALRRWRHRSRSRDRADVRSAAAPRAATSAASTSCRPAAAAAPAGAAPPGCPTGSSGTSCCGRRRGRARLARGPCAGPPAC
jgi:FkbM family methyltransferase